MIKISGKNKLVLNLFDHVKLESYSVHVTAPWVIQGGDAQLKNQSLYYLQKLVLILIKIFKYIRVLQFLCDKSYNLKFTNLPFLKNLLGLIPNILQACKNVHKILCNGCYEKFEKWIF